MAISASVEDPSLLNYGAVLFDTMAVVLPVPGGAGAAIKASKAVKRSHSPLELAKGVTRVAKSTVNTVKQRIIVWRATRRTGNFGVGKETRAGAEKIGKLWVRKGYRVASDGKTLISKDGLRQYRPDALKKSLNKRQANLESRLRPEGPWTGNAHLDIVGEK